MNKLILLSIFGFHLLAFLIPFSLAPSHSTISIILLAILTNGMHFN